jgi:hypothetical protein
MLRQWRERKLNGRKAPRRGRRARVAAGALTWAEMTPYQRWIVEAARNEQTIPVPEGTKEEIAAWMLAGCKKA